MPDPTPIPAPGTRQQAAEGLDLDALSKKWLGTCSPCDFGLNAMACTHPNEDYRPTMRALITEVRHWKDRAILAEDPTLTSLPGRCADHALTHCFDCGWITPADAAELYRLKRRPDADGSAQLIASIREQISHAAMNGHHLSSDCQGVAPGERPPAVRTANIEATIEGWLWRGETA